MFKKAITTSLSKYLSVLFLITSLVFLSAGCEKKAEKPEGEGTMKDTTNMAQPETDTTAKVDTTKMYPDLMGTWVGKFDKRPTTFIITEQNQDTFKGNLTVPYKQPLKKEISGKIKSDTQIYMEDLVHSRYMGVYNGQISNDGKEISGTFTMNANNSKIDFTFSKK